MRNTDRFRQTGLLARAPAAPLIILAVDPSRLEQRRRDFSWEFHAKSCFAAFLKSLVVLHLPFLRNLEKEKAIIVIIRALASDRIQIPDTPSGVFSAALFSIAERERCLPFGL